MSVPLGVSFEHPNTPNVPSVQMTTFIQAHSAFLLTGLGALSVVTFVTSLIALPIIITRLPVDHFISQRARSLPWRGKSPLRSTVLVILRNLLGALLVLGGLLMLVLPGQGLLTIVIGLLMIDTPKKRAFQAWLLAWKPVNRGINWMRRKANQPEFMLSA
jgi:hypothetical protein